MSIEDRCGLKFGRVVCRSREGLAQFGECQGPMG
jgi:hypothetical protein